AVLAEQGAVGTDVEQRAEERAAAVGRITLDDAHAYICTRFAGCLPHALDLRSRHIDGGRPVALPHAAAGLRPAAHRGAEREPPRIPADERFGKEDQPCPS